MFCAASRRCPWFVLPASQSGRNSDLNLSVSIYAVYVTSKYGARRWFFSDHVLGPVLLPSIFQRAPQSTRADCGSQRLGDPAER